MLLPTLVCLVNTLSTKFPGYMYKYESSLRENNNYKFEVNQYCLDACPVQVINGEAIKARRIVYP